MRTLQIDLSFPGGARVDARFDEFSIASDQPVAAGGEGTAPAPLDAFIAAMANCVGYFVTRFLDSREIDREGLEVRVIATPDQETHLFREIRIEITPPKALPAKYARALAAAAERCSVKRHLSQPPEFTTVVGEVAESADR